VAAELDLRARCWPARSMSHKLHALAAVFLRFRRDLSFVLPEATPYERLESAARGAEPSNLEAIEYVTTYRGKKPRRRSQEA